MNVKQNFKLKGRSLDRPTVNNVPIPRVHIHKYLGVQMSFMKSLQAIHYVQDLCLPQLAPLWLHFHCYVTALYTLQSTFPMDCDLVNKCLDLIHALKGAGAMVHFTWIPSHMGIPLNEKPDCLAQCALKDDTVDHGTEYTLDFVHRNISDQLELCCHRGSSTSLHYARVS
ncbi:hypothetical protein E2C01_066019 [Portunus trituberculatus]|uniref:RNase H type-1 domain-containing protein n=1 Tax=Portunus trituberculatus TaxID=210409 RepID=A0A5B7HNN7_PORTR|nr:hypothetical protein [Portunus trituberculatus]